MKKFSPRLTWDISGSAKSWRPSARVLVFDALSARWIAQLLAARWFRDGQTELLPQLRALSWLLATDIHAFARQAVVEGSCFSQEATEKAITGAPRGGEGLAGPFCAGPQASIKSTCSCGAATLRAVWAPMCWAGEAG